MKKDKRANNNKNRVVTKKEMLVICGGRFNWSLWQKVFRDGNSLVI
jgi:hypothetical protein